MSFKASWTQRWNFQNITGLWGHYTHSWTLSLVRAASECAVVRWGLVETGDYWGISWKDRYCFPTSLVSLLPGHHAIRSLSSVMPFYYQLMDSASIMQALVYAKQWVACAHTVGNGKQLHLSKIMGRCIQGKSMLTNNTHTQKWYQDDRKIKLLHTDHSR